MVEFSGYITGSAEKHYWKKSRRAVTIAMSLAALLVAVPFVVFSISSKNWEMLSIAVLGVVFVYSITFIPIGKKQRLDFTPSKIFVQDEYLVCVGKKFTESAAIEDVVKLVDYGEFYDLSFPFGKLNDKFVCQKSLLSKGTLEEFEALFEGKIIRKAK